MFYFIYPFLDFSFQKQQNKKLLLRQKLSYVHDCQFWDGEFCFEFPWHANRLLLYFFPSFYMLFIFNRFILLLECWYFHGRFHSKMNKNNRDISDLWTPSFLQFMNSIICASSIGVARKLCLLVRFLCKGDSRCELKLI